MKKLPFPAHIIVLLLTLIFISTACISDLDPRFFNSEYSGEISITHSGPLSNATFIIPIPVRDNSPGLLSADFTKPDFSSDNVTVSLTQSPQGLDLSNATSIRGYEPWFLIIRTDSSVPESSPYHLFHVNKDIQIELEIPDFRVDTLVPVGNETLIAPKFQFIRPDPPQVSSKSPERIVYKAIKNSYSTPVYVDFSAPLSTRVEIFCNVRGTNYWREYDDAGGSNQYQDSYSKIFFGDAHGWYMANGELKIADGFFPNFDHPAWQKVLNDTMRT